jgi:hypothetical protein
VRAIRLDEAGGIAGPLASVDVLALHEGLGRLAELDGRKSQLVELPLFRWLGIDETAAGPGVSPATVKREWTTARAWLRREPSVA